MHLAQINVGRLRAPIDDPMIADFFDALDEVNALAERSHGFVWRLQTEEGNATAIRPYEDELIAVNMSVWESIDTLADYVYRSMHSTFLRRRREWFDRFETAHMALWWIPAGSQPTLDDAIERLAHLERHGPTPLAFTFRHRFDSDDQPATSDERDACPA